MIIKTYTGGNVTLPFNMVGVQDGPYFYMFRDQAHADRDGEYPLLFIDTQIDVEMGDVQAAELARSMVSGRYCQHNIDYI